MKKGETLVSLDALRLKGFERVEHVSKTSYQDSSMVVIVPSREPYLHTTFVQALQSLAWPMNQRRAMFFVSGGEVGKAYDETLKSLLAHPELGAWKYLLTLEDDTLPPGDAVLRLIEAIEQGPYDGVGGMYFTKGEVNMPMCYGDPAEFTRTGVLDFRPRDVARALRDGMLIECNGIAMGCSLYRLQSFRDVPGPWFVTMQEGAGGATQDLFWCAKARRAGKRFAVDCRVRCAHADWKSGVLY
jgi:hypothetical protein